MTLCILLAIWFANSIGTFKQSDQFFNDLFQSSFFQLQTPDEVLLVYAPVSDFEGDESRLPDLIAQLGAHRPKKIGIIHEVTDDQFEMLERSPYASKIVAGTSLTKLTQDPVQQDEEQLSVISRGFIDLDLRDQAVYREHNAILRNDDQVYLSLEAKIAKTLLRTRSQLPEGRFGIQFSGGPNSLPHIDADAVLNDEIIKELIEDRVVLIGPEPGKSIGFVTPTTSGSQRMTRLELHGNILNTVLLQSFIRKSGNLIALITLLVISIFCCQLFRQIKQRWLIRSLILTAIAMSILAWTSFTYASLALPFSAVICVLLTAAFSSLYRRFHTLNEIIEYWRMMRHSNQKTMSRTSEHDAWTAISDSVYQIFYPTRMVLMELQPGATHLSTVKAVHCDKEHILEQRRDINRVPYRDAIADGKPGVVANRRFFIDNGRDDQQTEYMVPLILVSELIGFMVLEMDNEATENWQDFENFLSRFANDMAVFLAEGRTNSSETLMRERTFRKLKVLPEKTTALSLFKEEAEIRNNENLLGDTFDTLETSGAICNVFGRIVRTNSAMIDLLQKDGVVIGNSDCVEILTALTGRSKNECRKMFRSCVVEGHSEQIFLRSDENSASRVLFLKPLNRGGKSNLTSRCVSIQVIDGEIFRVTEEWQNRFAESNVNSVAQQLKHLSKLSDQLGSEKQSDHDAHQLNADLANEIIDVVNECQSMIGSSITESPLDIIRLDVRSIFETTLERHRMQLESNGVVTVPRFEEQPYLAVANPFLLERIFGTIFDCIIQNATDETEMHVGADIVDDKIQFYFRNRIAGAPISGLRKSLDLQAHATNRLSAAEGDALSLLTTEQIDRFNAVEDWLVEWNGSMNIKCCDSYRISVDLSLSTELPVAAAAPHPNHSNLDSNCE